MKITKTLSLSGLVTNYKLSLSFSGEEENSVSWNESKEYQTLDAQFTDEDFYEIQDKQDNLYDEYRRKELNKIIK